MDRQKALSVVLPTTGPVQMVVSDIVLPRSGYGMGSLSPSKIIMENQQLFYKTKKSNNFQYSLITLLIKLLKPW